MAESEKDSTSTSGNEGTTAVAEPKQEAKEKTKAASKKKPRKLPLYNVILLNDDDHSFEYVVEMLKALFAHPEEEGFRLAQEVDNAGRAIVLTTHKEKAELKRDQIHAYGTDWRVATCKGSMSAIVEPVDPE